MLSLKTAADIARVTDDALRTIPAQRVIELVTVIRGYVELATMSPGQTHYENKIVTAILDLHIEIQRHNTPRLLAELEELSAEIKNDLH